MCPSEPKVPSESDEDEPADYPRPAPPTPPQSSDSPVAPNAIPEEPRSVVCSRIAWFAAGWRIQGGHEQLGAHEGCACIFRERLVSCEVGFGGFDAGLVGGAKGLGNALDLDFHLGDLHTVQNAED